MQRPHSIPFMVPLLGFLITLGLFLYYKRYLQRYRDRETFEEQRVNSSSAAPGGECLRWHEQWHRQWGEKFYQQAERRLREIERQAQLRRWRVMRQLQRLGLYPADREEAPPPFPGTPEIVQDSELLRRARKQAAAEVGYYIHLMVFLGVLSILCLINVFTTPYPWFIWPALGWGLGLFIHYVAVMGSRLVRKRYFLPAVSREVRREKMMLLCEKRGFIDELSASIAHEIRNPIAAAKSLIQQIGEDPSSADNAEYARVAVSELDRVERRIAHLLRYAKEEDYHFEHIDISAVVESALAQMKAKLEGAGVRVVRNYAGGATVFGDGEKLRQVFSNILDNAVHALLARADGRRIDVLIENGGQGATVRVRDNGCGIAPDKIDKIFNPFFTTKEEGTGLGMAISKKIVEAHDGIIDVISQAGQGAEFVVSLPR